MAITPNTPFGTLGEDLVAKDVAGRVRARIDGNGAGMFLFDESGNQVFHLEMPDCNLRFGGHGQDGDIIIFRRAANTLEGFRRSVLHFNGEEAALRLGGKGVAGSQVCLGEGGEQTVFLDGAGAMIITGGNGADGTIVVQNENEVAGVSLNASNSSVVVGGAHAFGRITIRDASGSSAVLVHAEHTDGQQSNLALLRVGRQDRDGWLEIFGRGADRPSVRILGDLADIRCGEGAETPAGAIGCWSAQGIPAASLSGDGVVQCGTRGQLSGSLQVFSRNADNFANGVFAVDGDNASVSLGDVGLPGRMVVRNGQGENTISIDAEAGDIIVPNGDVAEDFEVADRTATEPGTVVIADEDGVLRPSEKAYDKCVVGIVAGAGGVRPGLILGRRADDVSRVPVALFGTANCRVDAREHPIAVGDLLTSAVLPGAAQKAMDPARAFGATIGKALRPLAGQVGLVPVLVSLR